MEKALVKIGNSKGVVIPKNYLKFFGDSVNLEMTVNGLLIKPAKSRMLSLRELLDATNVDALFGQMQLDADKAVTQAYYKSDEVQQIENPDDVSDEY